MLRQKYAAALVAFLFIASQLACGRLSGGGEMRPNGGPKTSPHFKPGFNLFSPEQDIQLGRQSAQQIAREVPLLRDEATVSYVRSLGAKLAAKAGGYQFPYQFNVVATRDINAFALPGGFIFVNAGAIMAAKNEGELAGVMAHEISHVALRHGTSQATKQYIAKAGLSIALSVLAGGGDSDLSNVLATIGGAGANLAFLKFGRTAETQADLEGARIMAASGYDPRDMAGFFKTLEAQGGQRVPEFLSDHPDPGNRIQSINNVARTLPVAQNPVRDTSEFQAVKARLTGSAAARSSASPDRVGPEDPNNARMRTRPAPPSSTFVEYVAGDRSFALQYPDNWEGLSTDEANFIFAPPGAYGKLNDSIVVTHGIFIGVVAPGASDLASATSAFVEAQLQANPDFQVSEQPQEINFGGRRGYATVVAGPSPVTGVVEVDVIYTTATADGRLFYFITMAPRDEYESYRPTFERIISSIRLAG
ncbi:MAG TPA: M48 family metalloprotease [Blastocatellia bacterium]|nr:M48 family metalloprotease [Blastocatellia bacterium]